MKLLGIILLSSFLSLSLFADAQKLNTGDKQRNRMRAFIQLKNALNKSQAGQYQESTKRLFLLEHHPSLKKQRSKIRYHLARDLYNMGLYHPAVFQLQTLIKNKDKRYMGKSLEKIALIAGHLGDDRLLNHAISQGSLKYISGSEKQKLHYHFGEFFMRKKKFRRAITHFSRVQSSSSFFYKSLYQIGLAHAELNNIQRAASIFDSLESRRTGVTDNLKISAIMGKARVYYQGKQWKKSVESYLRVPKDSPFWHDTLLERSWALLRAGRLRSALSNFQTLHSSYYKGYYQPESLLLRSIIYLYICKYYEMEKVLDLFNKVYQPVFSNVKNLIRNSFPSKTYYQSLLLATDNRMNSARIKYPLPVARRILREGDISAMHYYVTELKKERDRVYLLPYAWRRSKMGKYAVQLINRRLSNAQKKAGKKTFLHLKKIRSELKDFFLQAQYIRYEMLRSKRGFLKKKIARKHLAPVRIEDFDRSYYVQNGYEYWPFKGEYWLDELGNYHYVGMGSCNR